MDLRVKEFKRRESLLTNLFTFLEIKSAFNIACSSIIFFFCITVVTWLHDHQA